MLGSVRRLVYVGGAFWIWLRLSELMQNKPHQICFCPNKFLCQARSSPRTSQDHRTWPKGTLHKSLPFSQALRAFQVSDTLSSPPLPSFIFHPKKNTFLRGQIVESLEELSLEKFHAPLPTLTHLQSSLAFLTERVEGLIVHTLNTFKISRELSQALQLHTDLRHLLILFALTSRSANSCLRS